MITLLTGENSFELQRFLNKLRSSFRGEVLDVDGAELELRSIPDILMGTSLFSTNRLVVIKALSENKALWAGFIDWLPKLSDDVHLVLIEPKPDKRTTTYKELKKNALVQEFMSWGERDIVKAEQWVEAEAKNQRLMLDKKSIQLLVRRTGVDQWQLFHAVEKLSLLDAVTLDSIEDIIDTEPNESVFSLFDTALRGDTEKLLSMMKTLELSQDPYALFGLLSSQVFQLAAVVMASDSDNVAKDFGIHPFVVSKLSSTAKKQGRLGVRKILAAFAKADDDMKVSKADPWILIEHALVSIAIR